MHRSRSKKIAGVSITKDGLVSLYNLLQRKAEASAKGVQISAAEAPYNRPTVKVLSANSMATSDDSGGIFSDEVIDTQKTTSVEMVYGPLHVNQRITIDLEEVDPGDYRSSTFKVSGSDPTWVDGTFAEIERLIDGFPRRKIPFIFLPPWRRIVQALVGLAIGYGYIRFIVPTSDTSTPPPAWVTYIQNSRALMWTVAIGLQMGMGWFPAGWLLSWVEKLWPVVEFDFGPEHHKQRKTGRIMAAWLLAAIVLPLLYDAFKKYVLNW